MSIRYDLLDPGAVMELLVKGTPRGAILQYAAILRHPKKHAEKKFQDWFRYRRASRRPLRFEPMWNVLCLFCRETMVVTDKQLWAGHLDGHRNKHIDELLAGKYAHEPRTL